MNGEDSSQRQTTNSDKCRAQAQAHDEEKSGVTDRLGDQALWMSEACTTNSAVKGIRSGFLGVKDVTIFCIGWIRRKGFGG